MRSSESECAVKQPVAKKLLSPSKVCVCVCVCVCVGGGGGGGGGLVHVATPVPTPMDVVCYLSYCPHSICRLHWKQ